MACVTGPAVQAHEVVAAPSVLGWRHALGQRLAASALGVAAGQVTRSHHLAWQCCLLCRVLRLQSSSMKHRAWVGHCPVVRTTMRCRLSQLLQPARPHQSCCTGTGQGSPSRPAGPAAGGSGCLGVSQTQLLPCRAPPALGPPACGHHSGHAHAALMIALQVLYTHSCCTSLR